jgi:choline-sulfatase
LFARRRIFDYAMEKVAPFAMVVSFIHPHDPYVARPEWWHLYDHAAIDMPATPQATDPHSQRDDAAASRLTSISRPRPQIRNARHAYYANTSYFDSKVGAVVQALEESGQLDNTVVVVTADHGDMLGERGLWYKMTFFERSGRVPLMMAGPGVAPRAVAEPCSLVDLLPTFVDIAREGGAAIPDLGAPVDGRSLWPLAKGAAEGGDEAIGEYCAELRLLTRC